MNSLKENDAYDIVCYQNVGHHWLGMDAKFIQLNPAKRVKNHTKYIFLAKGYLQVSGIEYQETFFPTLCIISVQMLMQLAVQFDLIVLKFFK